MNDQSQTIETAVVATNPQSETRNEATEPRHPAGRPQSSAPAVRNPKSRRVRNGKIARLPVEIREAVSLHLYNGETHDFIVQDLREDGYPDITRQNIGQWAKGGYQDWLKTRKVFDSISLKTEAFDLYPYDAGRDSLKVNKLNNFMLATRMHQVIELLDPKELARLVAADPDLFFRFIKEEFNRQQQERELEYKIEDRKESLRRREQIDLQVHLAMLPEAERSAYIAKKKAEIEALRRELNN